jgi:hypothetical protein
MASGPATAIRHLRAFLADADPARIPTARAAALLRGFVELGRLVEAGKVLFAARAAESTHWVDEGHASAASWLAEQAQEPMGEAISAIETSRRLRHLPDTADALRAGRLSGAQVKEVARAADKDPSAEAELLELAGRESLKRLKDRSRQVLAETASRQDELARQRAIHDKRYLRTFTDHLGGFRLDARLTPERGAQLVAAIQAEADARFEEARRDGTRELPEKYRADALVALVTGEGPVAEENGRRSRSRTQTVIRIDAGALQRGHVAGGEVCEIAGVGRVAVATVEELLPRSFAKVLIHNGIDVLSVTHVGRTITAHMETALAERDLTCRVPGCDVSKGLEAHHYKGDFAETGVTSLACLALVCARHHDLITYGGHVLGGGPGNWWYQGSRGEPADVFDDTG